LRMFGDLIQLATRDFAYQSFEQISGHLASLAHDRSWCQAFAGPAMRADCDLASGTGRA
jgi:hypothetical protein